MVRENPLRDESRSPVSNLENVDSNHPLRLNIHLTFLRNNKKNHWRLNFRGDGESYAPISCRTSGGLTDARRVVRPVAPVDPGPESVLGFVLPSSHKWPSRRRCHRGLPVW